MNDEPEIIIIVPVFNEEDNVLPLADELVAAMQQLGRTYEILFVDDTSTDATWERIREAHDRHGIVNGLRHERNAGQSAALWTGIQATTNPIIVTLDGDRQNDPADLPKLLAELQDCDFVCGVRAKRQDTWLRRVSTKVARAARHRVLKVDFCDTGCAFRAFKRSAIDGVLPFNGVHRFLPVLVHGNGARTKETPIGHRARVAGVSKYGLWNRLGRGIYDLIGLSWYQKRRLPRLATTRLDSVPAAEMAGRAASSSEKIKTPAPGFQPTVPR